MGAERATEPPSVYHYNDGKRRPSRRADRAEQTQTAPQIASRSTQAQTEPRRRYNTTTRRKQGSPRRIHAEITPPRSRRAGRKRRPRTPPTMGSPSRADRAADDPEAGNGQPPGFSFNIKLLRRDDPAKAPSRSRRLPSLLFRRQKPARRRSERPKMPD